MTSLIKDRATEYAEGVVNGTIIAGPNVRDACQRHIADDPDSTKESPNARGLYFDKNEVAKAIRFFENGLCLNGGQFEGIPFLLLPWQSFVIGSIFGWKRASDDMRRFRVVYIETPKGSGKSPLCAGIGLKGLVADNEPRAEIYAAATFKDQAMVLFRDAMAFYDQSPKLQSRLNSSGAGAQRWNLAYLAKGSFFRVISSEKKGQSGPRPHMALLDEIHEHRDGTVIEMLRAGFKFRRQPLSVMITNSGHDKTSVCWEYHDMGAKVSARQIENDEFFAYICALDDDDLIDDKYLHDEKLWPKVNPSLDAGIPGYDYIRGQVNEALGMPSKMATVKRLCFCQWTEADNPWIDSNTWFACQDKDFDAEQLVGRRCWGGLDLSAVRDLTAFALLFEPAADDPYWRLKVWFWLPGIGLKAKSDQDKVPYIAWKEAGYLTAIDRKTIDYEFVITDLQRICGGFDVQKIAFDRWNMANFTKELDRIGADLPELQEFGQGFQSMGPAVKEFEKLLDGKIRHDGNPVLTWCAANTVAVEDPAENKKLDKARSTGRIDGIVAAVMSAGIIDLESGTSVYETRGVISRQLN
jgi:phage terminase large subunit-like protein